MRLSETAPWCGTSQERHEGGAPYHRTVRCATGLWIVVFLLFTTRVDCTRESPGAALAARSDTSTRRRIHSFPQVRSGHSTEHHAPHSAAMAARCVAKRS